jgi:molybdate transport system ATP-binding protein
MQEPAVVVQLRKRVHSELTLDVAFELGKECSILFGRSGSGKTTTLRCIAGMCRPDSGRVTMNGSAMYDSQQGQWLPMRKRQVSMIFQDDLLFPHLTARENIRYGLNKWSAAQQADRVKEMADLFLLGPLLDREPARLSGGEKQRVGLARAIAPRPRLLLCDEPISAIDQEGRSTLVGHLRRIQQTEQIPVLYVTHSMNEAMALGDRLFAIEKGQIIARGTPIDVFSAPRQLPLARLTRVQNIFSATVESHAPQEGATLVRIAGGPTLRVPLLDAAVGTSRTFGLRADDILLARHVVTGISAQNILEGRVAEILRHNADVEVLIECGTRFVASVVPASVQSLGLEPGATVFMIIKARSCHLLETKASGGEAAH